MFSFGQLNKNQRLAVETTEGPVLIIAGPGTGKTYTLVKRIAYLITEKHIKPFEIVAVTFTEKAARELVTRISNELADVQNININEMYIGTFHSVCLRLMKEFSLSDGAPKSVLDAFETRYLVCRNIDRFKFLGGFKEQFPDKMGPWKQAMEICRYSSQLLEELADIDKMENDSDENMRLLAKNVRRYKALLDENNCMDFSSIQTDMYYALKKSPDTLDRIRERIKYIMVDEYQDTNYIQESLVFLLAGDRKNICVVGDDDQGMYRFRGATIRNILEFPDKFPEGVCKRIYLDENYRSEPGIIDFYNRWMRNADGITLFNWNKYRYDKTIVSGKEQTFPGRSVYKADENFALSMIKKLMDNGNISNFNQVAFLFRSVKNQGVVKLAKELEDSGIPVYSPRSGMFFERDEVRQIIGCFILCFTDYLTDLKNNTFKTYINERLREYYISCVKSALGLLKEHSDLNNYVKKQNKAISNLSGESETGLLDIFYRLISFEPFKSYMSVGLTENAVKVRAARNLSEISRLLSRFSRLHNMHSISFANKVNFAEELFNVYLKYLYIDGIGEYEDKAEYAPHGCVSFMTIHQSKGLEFPVTVVGSLNANPGNKNDALMAGAEARFFNRKPYEPLEDIKYFDFWRLYYTAFSRAQNMLVLLTSKCEGRFFEAYISSVPNINRFEEKIPFEAAKSASFKRVYSYTSHISLYDGCPRQYKFYKEFALAQNKMLHTEVGSLIHATLEDINRCAIAGEYEKITDENIGKWFDLNYRAMSESTGFFLDGKALENALGQIKMYCERNREMFPRVLYSEEEINLILPEFIMQGVIDLVISDGDNIEIVDYKTGPKPDISKNPDAFDHYKKQLEIYAYLAQIRLDKRVSRMKLYYTRDYNAPVVTFDYEQKNIDRTIAELTETVGNIESRNFEMGARNNYACQFCDMKYYCGRTAINI